MTTDTHTTAGLLATAGAARLGTVSPASCALAYGEASVHQGPGGHQLSTWTPGAFAASTTGMVIDAKNRPTRPLSELSP